MWPATGCARLDPYASEDPAAAGGSNLGGGFGVAGQALVPAVRGVHRVADLLGAVTVRFQVPVGEGRQLHATRTAGIRLRLPSRSPDRAVRPPRCCMCG